RVSNRLVRRQSDRLLCKLGGGAPAELHWARRRRRLQQHPRIRHAAATRRSRRLRRDRNGGGRQGIRESGARSIPGLRIAAQGPFLIRSADARALPAAILVAAAFGCLLCDRESRWRRRVFPSARLSGSDGGGRERTDLQLG